MSSYFKLVFLICFLFSTATDLQAKGIFENRSQEELLQSSIDKLKKLKLTQSESEDFQSQDLQRLRLGQLLVLKEKRANSKIDSAYVRWYLDETQACLSKPEECLNENADEYKSSFYSWIQDRDIEVIEESLSSLKAAEKLSDYRAKLLSLLFESLELGVQEVDGPNDDSRRGKNYISQYFSAAGVSNPARELPESRIDWAWCAAFVTSLVNQAGAGFSFISLQEHINSCKELDKLKHCHPIQVEYILNWAKNKATVFDMNHEALLKALPGDILVLNSPKTKRPSHIGFYLAKSKDCSEDECWVYTLEGNAGPFINDKLEDNWSEVQQILQNKNITQFEYERLLDRATIVKRPAKNWDFLIQRE